MISEGAGAFSQRSFHANEVVLGGGGDLGFVVGIAGGKHMINDAGEFMRERSDGGGCAEFRAEAAKDIAEG